MTKNTTLGYGVLAVAFILLTTIAFLLPIEKTINFWISYSFTVLAFALQVLIWSVAFKQATTMKSKFLGLPTIYIGTIYLIAQIISFASILAISTMPTWITIVSSTIILGIAVICLISAEIGRGEVAIIETSVLKKTALIKIWQTEVELVAQAETDEKSRVALEKLAEQLKYSDPMSSEALSVLEIEIQRNLALLKNSSKSDTIKTILQLELLLTERNQKSKLLK